MIGETARHILIAKVTALVDWNSQIHNAKPPRASDERIVAERTLAYVGRTVSRALAELDASTRFDVTLRVYGGWHRGFEATPRRKALIAAASKFENLSSRAEVIIRPNIEFGDRLISAQDTRLHAHLNAHLADTYRKDLYDESRLVEKMVDTSLASDLVDLAHSDATRWLLVVGEDDDLIPPLIVAKGIRGPENKTVTIVRKRLQTSFLKFNDLRIEPWTSKN